MSTVNSSAKWSPSSRCGQDVLKGRGVKMGEADIHSRSWVYIGYLTIPGLSDEV